MMIVIAVVHFAKNLTAVGHYTMIFNTHMDPHGQKKCRIMGFKLNWIFNKHTKQTNYYKQTRKLELKGTERTLASLTCIIWCFRE